MKTQSWGRARASCVHDDALRFLPRKDVAYLGRASDYKKNRYNFNQQDDFKKNDPPYDGKVTWIKGKVRKKYVYGVKNAKGEYGYECRYDEGPKDREWMEAKDKEYLKHLLNTGKLKETEPDVWRLREMNKARSKDIGEWWSQKLKLQNIGDILARSKQDYEQFIAREAVERKKRTAAKKAKAEWKRQLEEKQEQAREVGTKIKYQSFGISETYVEDFIAYQYWSHIPSCCVAPDKKEDFPRFRELAITDYRRNRENGESQDNPNWNFPQDGESYWFDREHPPGGKYYGVRYDEGPHDKIWMDEKDRNYLNRLKREKQVETKEQQIPTSTTPSQLSTNKLLAVKPLPKPPVIKPQLTHLLREPLPQQQARKSLLESREHFTSAISFNRQGKSKYYKGDYDGAIANYDEAIKLNSEYATAYNNRGLAKHKSGDHKGAITDYNKAIELQPRYVIAYNNRGVAKYDEGDYDGAVTDYDKAIELNPEYTDTDTNRRQGKSKYYKGDYDGAIANYDEAIKLNSEYATACNNRGLAKYERGDHNGAKSDYNKAIELQFKCVTAYNNRGLTKCEKKDYDGAIADYNKAIELSPEYVIAYNNRGLAKYEKGDYDGAIADYDIAIGLSPEYTDADINRVLAKCMKSIECFYFSAVSFNNWGLVKHGKRNYDGAIADYNVAIELDSRYAVAYYNRGLTKYESGNYNGAIVDYDKAIELDSKYAAAYSSRGFVKYEKGDYDGAMADYDKAIELNPEYISAYDDRGFLKIKIGDYDGAKKDFLKDHKSDFGVRNISQTQNQLIMKNLILEAIKQEDPIKLKQLLTQLTSLDLWSSQIGDTGAVVLAAALKDNQTITLLNLGRNGIGDIGIEAFAATLKDNRTITWLHFGDNQISNVGAKVLVDALRDNYTLIKLILFDNQIDLVLREKINQLISQNNWRRSAQDTVHELTIEGISPKPPTIGPQQTQSSCDVAFEIVQEKKGDEVTEFEGKDHEEERLCHKNGEQPILEKVKADGQEIMEVGTELVNGLNEISSTEVVGAIREREEQIEENTIEDKIFECVQVLLKQPDDVSQVVIEQSKEIVDQSEGDLSELSAIDKNCEPGFHVEKEMYDSIGKRDKSRRVLLGCEVDVNAEVMIKIDNSKIVRGAILLYTALSHSDEEKAIQLIKNGADVNAKAIMKNVKGMIIEEVTPLHLALLSGLKGVVRYLIECGADVNAEAIVKTDDGVIGKGMPLDIALFRGLEEVAELLIEYGAGVVESPEELENQEDWRIFETVEKNGVEETQVFENIEEENVMGEKVPRCGQQSKHTSLEQLDNALQVAIEQSKEMEDQTEEDLSKSPTSETMPKDQGPNSDIEKEVYETINFLFNTDTCTENNWLSQLFSWLSSITFDSDKDRRNVFGLSPYNVHYEVGNCLFVAIAAYDPNNSRDSAEMRRLAVEHIRKDDELKDRINSLAGHNDNRIRIESGHDVIYSSFDEYIKYMSSNQTWGTEIEAVALSRVLNRPIIILPPNNEFAWIIEQPGYAQSDPIFIEYQGDNHYVPLSVPGNSREILEQIRRAHENQTKDGNITPSNAEESKKDDTQQSIVSQTEEQSSNQQLEDQSEEDSSELLTTETTPKYHEPDLEIDVTEIQALEAPKIDVKQWEAELETIKRQQTEQILSPDEEKIFNEYCRIYEQKLNELSLRFSQESKAKQDEITTQIQVLNQYNKEKEASLRGQIDELKTLINKIKSSGEQQTKEEHSKRLELESKQRELEQELNILQQEFKPRNEMLQARKNIYQHPTLKAFYIRVQSELINIFSAYKSLASKLIRRESNKGDVVIKCLSKAGTFVPLPGAGMVTGAIGMGVQYFHDQYQSKKIARVAELVITLEEIDKLAELTARKLTYRYQNQLSIMPQAIVEKKGKLAVEIVCKYVESNTITNEREISDQLVEAVVLQENKFLQLGHTKRLIKGKHQRRQENSHAVKKDLERKLTTSMQTRVQNESFINEKLPSPARIKENQQEEKRSKTEKERSELLQKWSSQIDSLRVRLNKEGSAREKLQKQWQQEKECMEEQLQREREAREQSDLKMQEMEKMLKILISRTSSSHSHQAPSVFETTSLTFFNSGNSVNKTESQNEQQEQVCLLP